MSEYTHPVRMQGTYQVVAITTGPEFDPKDVIGYAVLTMGGAKIRQEASLDSALAWMDKMVEHDRPRDERERERDEPSVARTVKRVAKKRKGKGIVRRSLKILG